MTRSPLALAHKAMEVAAQALPAYASKYSKKDFTQQQLFAMLVLKQFFQTDYRGIVQLLADLSDLRRVLGIQKVPHFSTLYYAQKRLIKKGPLTNCCAQYSSTLARGA